jgi:hypothetical protein
MCSHDSTLLDGVMLSEKQERHSARDTVNPSHKTREKFQITPQSIPSPLDGNLITESRDGRHEKVFTTVALDKLRNSHIPACIGRIEAAYDTVGPTPNLSNDWLDTWRSIVL